MNAGKRYRMIYRTSDHTPTQKLGFTSKHDAELRESEIASGHYFHKVPPGRFELPPLPPEGESEACWESKAL